MSTNNFSIFKYEVNKHCSGQPDHIIPDGRVHRFHIQGDKPGKLNGWYAYHATGLEAGVFGSWKDGIQHTWCSKRSDNQTIHERNAVQKLIDEAKHQRTSERQQAASEAREKAQYIWNTAEPAVDDCPYLQAKQIPVYKLRVYKGPLVAPAYDTSGQIHTLQFIDNDGQKRFLKGGAKKGHCYPIGKRTDRLLVCEGVATGHTLHQETGLFVLAAFDAGNLKPVAEALRTRYPHSDIIVCADNDHATDGNPGLTKARMAAEAVGGKLLVPKFPDGAPKDATDWNDWFRLGFNTKEGSVS